MGWGLGFPGGPFQMLEGVLIGCKVSGTCEAMSKPAILVVSLPGLPGLHNTPNPFGCGGDQKRGKSFGLVLSSGGTGRAGRPSSNWTRAGYNVAFNILQI